MEFGRAENLFLNIVVTKGFAVFFLLLSYCSLISQASQAHVTSVLCKLTFSQESQCRAGRPGVVLQATVETLYEKQNTEVCER